MLTGYHNIDTTAMLTCDNKMNRLLLPTATRKRIYMGTIVDHNELINEHDYDQVNDNNNERRRLAFLLPGLHHSGLQRRQKQTATCEHGQRHLGNTNPGFHLAQCGRG